MPLSFALVVAPSSGAASSSLLRRRLLLHPTAHRASSKEVGIEVTHVIVRPWPPSTSAKSTTTHSPSPSHEWRPSRSSTARHGHGVHHPHHHRVHHWHPAWCSRASTGTHSNRSACHRRCIISSSRHVVVLSPAAHHPASPHRSTVSRRGVYGLVNPLPCASEKRPSPLGSVLKGLPLADDVKVTAARLWLMSLGRLPFPSVVCSTLGSVENSLVVKPVLQPVRLVLRARFDVSHAVERRQISQGAHTSESVKLRHLPLGLSVDLVLGEGDVRKGDVDTHLTCYSSQILVRNPLQFTCRQLSAFLDGNALLLTQSSSPTYKAFWTLGSSTFGRPANASRGDSDGYPPDAPASTGLPPSNVPPWWYDGCCPAEPPFAPEDDEGTLWSICKTSK